METRADLQEVHEIWDNPSRIVPTLMLRTCNRLLVGATIGLVALVSGCASIDGVSESRLDLVKQRGELLCGVSGKIPGFSFLSAEGSYTGQYRQKNIWKDNK